MKRLLYLLMILPGCLLISCNDKSGPSAAAQKNLDAMHAVNACFESKDFSKLGDYIAEDGVDHAGENGDIKGLANMKTEFKKMVDKNKIDLPSGITRGLSDEQFDTMINVSLGMKPLWENALGKDWEKIMTREKLRALYERL